MHLLPDTRRRVVIYLVYQNLLGVPSTGLRDAVGLLVMPGFQFSNARFSIVWLKGWRSSALSPAALCETSTG